MPIIPLVIVSLVIASVLIDAGKANKVSKARESFITDCAKDELKVKTEGDIMICGPEVDKVRVFQQQ